METRELIIRHRAMGKTTELIKRAHEDGGHVVCMDQAECSRVFHLARDMGMPIPFPISFSDFISGHYAPMVKSLHIDNAEILLQRMAKLPIKTITMSYEPKDFKP